jgi:hypothetical protein
LVKKSNAGMEMCLKILISQSTGMINDYYFNRKNIEKPISTLGSSILTQTHPSIQPLFNQNEITEQKNK